jgi:DNA mismatch repair ATPase MutS
MNALALLFSYIEQVQYRPVSPVYAIRSTRDDDYVLLDDITRDNLELFSARYDASRAHSLYDVIHVTRTPM